MTFVQLRVAGYREKFGQVQRSGNTSGRDQRRCSLKCRAIWRRKQVTFSRCSPIENVEVIRRYDLVHAGAGENGHDIARPAEFLIDRSGTVRWIEFDGELLGASAARANAGDGKNYYAEL